MAAILLVLGFLPFGLTWMFDAHAFGDAVRTIRRVMGESSREASERAIRALSLLEPAGVRGASVELAQLHVERALTALSVDDVRARASRRGAVFGGLALVLAVATVAVCASNPWGVVEGFDVFFARGGEAPFAMDWLSDVDVQTRPPDYLHQDARTVDAYEDTFLPRGTLVTVRGAPIHAGRRLLLTDGSVEVPFVDDGTGYVVARWPLSSSARLRIVARFGSVIIPESRATFLESVADRAPDVVLEGAPKRIVLGSSSDPANADVSEIPIHYEATDDHGLREVHLVLRAGAREDRRVLANLDGETRIDRGGYLLRTTDPFIKKSHAPIEVRVEAKDADPITGPKWGSSEAILVVPPDVGEPEARRVAALLDVRHAVVDALAWRLSNAVPTDLRNRRAFFDEEARWLEQGNERLENALLASYAGVRVPGRLAAMLRGRMRKVGEAVKNQARSPSSAAHAEVVKATERMALVVDATVQGLGLRDARSVAKELSDVADDLALAASLAQKPAERARAEQRMDAAVMVLEGGERSLTRLSPLGRDLAEVVSMDLRRVARARSVDASAKGASPDFIHAALAAQDLAARLRQPDPSFGAAGGRPAHAGGESGGGQGSSGGDGEEDDVEQAFNEAAQELERLATEHAGQIGKVEQSMANGVTEEDRKNAAEEGKSHAEKVREAVRPFPNVGGDVESWSSKGATAREHAEQMARALEDGNVADAVQSGRRAMNALEEAEKAAKREGRFGDATPETITKEAKRTIEGELSWTEKKLDQLRKRASSRAGSELHDQGQEERKLADRASELARKGEKQEAMPKSAIDALEEAERAAREAATALEEGDGERGLARQREAQQKLESARDALGDGDGEGSRGGSESDDGRVDVGGGGIPKADAHKGPEELRRRILKGLGQPSGSGLKGAVKRYAEGLLR